MTASSHPQGLLDTNILILRRWIESNQLPDEMAISAVTLAELSAGPHQVRPDTEQNSYAEHADLMIAATAIAEDLPLFTTNPDDFNGLTDLLTIVPVSRPKVPHER